MAGPPDAGPPSAAGSARAPIPAVVVRDAVVPDELPVVAVLFREYAATLEVDLCFQGFPDELAGLPGRYARPAGGLWLAVAGDEAVGCVALRPLDATVCEIKRLYLRPSMRGSGAGRRLVTNALAAAARIGYVRVCLDTLPSMSGAIALYRSLGFEPITPYYDHPVPGALFLGRALDSA